MKLIEFVSSGPVNLASSDYAKSQCKEVADEYARKEDEIRKLLTSAPMLPSPYFRKVEYGFEWQEIEVALSKMGYKKTPIKRRSSRYDGLIIETPTHILYQYVNYTNYLFEL